MGEPLVSVVVISYNQAQYIIQNLDSLRSQTYTNWELIVADDASTDDSVEVFKKWLHENNISAKEIFHTKNTGLATVLNEAIEICSGDYVKLIAADDYLHPECLENSVHCLEEKGKEYGMVFTDTFCVDENNHALPDIADYNKLGIISPEEFKKELIKGNRIAALTVLMRTNVVRETGKYDSKYIVEDYHRWLMINELYYIAYISEKLAFYRSHGNNISKLKAKRIAEEDMELRLIYDKEGLNKMYFHNYFLDCYSLQGEIPAHLFNLYKVYSGRFNLLINIIRFKIHPRIYNLIHRFI